MAFTRVSRLVVLTGIAGLFGSTLAADQLSRRPDPPKTATVDSAPVVPDVRLKTFRLIDNGDNDGYADTNETVDMYVTLVNRSGVEITGVTASLTTVSPEIGCISVSSVSFGSMAILETKESPTAFRFSIAATANRTTVDERLIATFALAVQADQFTETVRALTIQTELDLDSIGGGAIVGYVESFESSSRTNFLTFTSTGANLDPGKASLALSDDYRCQYNDPDGPNPNQPGRPTCFMGFTNAANNDYDWHIHDGGAADNAIGRAYVGTRSLHWGVHPGAGAKRDTTRFSQLEAVRSSLPINLPVSLAAELSFKHQISLLDNRTVLVPDGEAADRAILAVQLAGNSGTGFGNWIKIFPYENQYDARGTDNFANCAFDPVDDGSDEDDYFDPGDPARRLGPSSTCFPEFVFAFAGDTDYRNSPGNMALIGRDTLDGPGLRGAIDRGTWIEPKFDLSAFRGRRIRLRFLVTSVEVEGAVTPDELNIGGDNEVGDDGWYIDDVRIPAALQTPVVLIADTRPNTGLSECCIAATPPEAFAGLVLAGGGGAPTELTWPSQPDSDSYDVTRGSLDVLQSSSGDFAIATDACLADDAIAPTAEDSAIPPAGSGFWYLVRGNNCAGFGSYDELSGQQPDGRDSEIEASAAACP